MQVEEDEVGADAPAALDRVRGRAGHLEWNPSRVEGLGEGLRDGRLVLDQEDRPPAGCHVHIVGASSAGTPAACAHGAAPAIGADAAAHRGGAVGSGQLSRRRHGLGRGRGRRSRRRARSRSRGRR